MRCFRYTVIVGFYAHKDCKDGEVPVVLDDLCQALSGKGFRKYLQGGRSMRGITVGVSGNNPSSDMYQSVSSRFSREADAQKKTQERQMRELLRGLQQIPERTDNPNAVATTDKLADFLKLSDSSEEDGEKEKPVQYNDKEVAAKIQSAKTSVGAGQAVLSAKRKVLELKRKIAAKSGDPEELQLALTHAKRMEIVAKKKKTHLELEEMVEVTQKRDERTEEAGGAMSGLSSAMASALEEDISGKEDEIFGAREALMREAAQENSDVLQGTEGKDLDDMNALIAEFGEEALRELEEMSELLPELEVADPHMSREELEAFKRKHRQAEQKEIVKADMDYLKGMIRHRTEGGSTSGLSGFSGTVGAMTGVPAAGGVQIDVQI